MESIESIVLIVILGALIYCLCLVCPPDTTLLSYETIARPTIDESFTEYPESYSKTKYTQRLRGATNVQDRSGQVYSFLCRRRGKYL